MEKVVEHTAVVNIVVDVFFFEELFLGQYTQRWFHLPFFWETL